MSEYPILIHPDKRLRLKAEVVKSFDKNLTEIAQNMFETMYKHKGIGLAATQVNLQIRLIVMDVPRSDEENSKKDKLVLVNPEIIWKSEEIFEYEEGCLSLPDQYAKVSRPAEIIVKFFDLEGKEIELKATKLLATCIQHEIDHLDGILFIDHLSRLKRERIETKLAKYLKQLNKS